MPTLLPDRPTTPLPRFRSAVKGGTTTPVATEGASFLLHPQALTMGQPYPFRFHGDWMIAIKHVNGTVEFIGADADSDTPSPTSKRVAQVEQLLEHYRGLAEDWDSYDGHPPTPRAIAGARRLIEIAHRVYGKSSEDAVPFHAAAIANGGILLEWEHGDKELEVEIGPDEALGYLLTVNAGHSPTYEEANNVDLGMIFKLLTRLIHG
jgi:hypothetical protein